MDEKRLEEIRANLPDPSADLSRRERDAHALLAHVDHLTAEVERLRAGIEEIRDRCFMEGSWADAKAATLLNPPTEGTRP